MITVTNKNKFLLPTYLAHKIIGIPTPNLSDIIIDQIRTQPPTLQMFYPPDFCIERLPMCRKARYSKSFIPVSIRNRPLMHYIVYITYLNQTETILGKTLGYLSVINE